MTEMTFTQLEKAIEAEIRFQYPNEDLLNIYARRLGTVMAYISRETLEKILEHQKRECIRCGQVVLPSQHGVIGCDS